RRVPARPERLAVPPDQLARVGAVVQVEDLAGRALDVAEALDPGEEGRRYRRRAALRERHGRLAGDHRRGVLVRARADLIERRLDRVGQDVGAADHGDAEHDRQRRQQGPELAPREPLEGDRGHYRLTSSTAAMISAALEPPATLAIWPSAR